MVSIRNKSGFSDRLNQVLDIAGIPKKGEARQKVVGDMFGVTNKGAWKWLNGESIPRFERLQEIVERFKKTGVTIEWLLSGDEKLSPITEVKDIIKNHYDDTNGKDLEIELITYFRKLTHKQQLKIFQMTKEIANENIEIVNKLQKMEPK